MMLQHLEGPVWAGSDSEIGREVREQSTNCLRAYEVNPSLVLEHANIERATAQGGYGRRQIYELVQNGADALMSTPGGRIHVLLTDTNLYCANEGRAVDTDGVMALLSSHISLKRGNEIGRFGLGFKSVLGVSNRPEFYSRTGSFAFDADWASELIQRIVPAADRYPVLRIAQVVDPVEAASKDSVLQEFMSWATSIVRLPRDPVDSAWLSDDLRNFPREFLLFSSHVGELILQDRTTGLRRELRVGREHGRLNLVEGDRSSTWRVFSANHVPSAAARKDAGELADRESLPIIWAVPLEGRAVRGRFWAFFPTEYFTTLSGILNAPWKTNEDRQNLLIGQFNSELLEAAAALIVDSLSELAEPSDPGRHLDLIPARGREAPNPADEELTDAVYRMAAIRPSIPDQLGKLQRPEDIHLHPDVANDREIVQLWTEAPNHPIDWCHPSIETRERRPRVERLLAAVGQGAASWTSWLEQIVSSADPIGSVVALRVVGRALQRASPDQRSQIVKARIVLTEDGRLVQPRPDQVFLAGDYRTTIPLVFVHREVARDPQAREALQDLDIKSVDPVDELDALLRAGLGSWTDESWHQLWVVVRKAGARALETLDRHRRTSPVQARTLAGRFRPLHSVLIPGPILPDGGAHDPDCTLDVSYHAAELELLAALGAASGPSVTKDAKPEPWFDEYRAAAIGVFLRALGDYSQQPHFDKLVFKPAVQLAPLEVLRHLTEDARVRFTTAVLEADPHLKPWQMVHSTRELHYPLVDVPAPHVWLLLRDGRLQTSLGPQLLVSCVGPRLEEWAALLPVANISNEASSTLRLPNSIQELTPELWGEALTNAASIEDDVQLGRLYALAAQTLPPPELIRCRVGDVHEYRAPVAVTAVTSKREIDALRQSGAPTILVATPAYAAVLTKRWGLQPADSAVTTEVFAVPATAPTPLLDEFPGLRWQTSESEQSMSLVRCTVLRIETLTEAGKQAEDKDFHVADGQIFWRGDDDVALLGRLRAEFNLQVSDADIDAILQDRQRTKRLQQVANVRDEATIEARLVKAVGSSGLLRHLPSSLVASVRDLHGPIDDLMLARLALAVYGIDILGELRTELEEKGFQPPAQWAGSSSARTFARDLGFPAEFAGFEHARRPPLLEIEGPPALPPLHDFQEEIRVRIHALLHAPKNRAILSLPTGAGKTRIAVQALIEEMADRGMAGPVLWVAQSDELCEQAVQSWAYVWRALGSRDTLTISRLWSSNEAVAVDSPAHVVVATIDKLQVCIPKAGYDWLKQASCLIVDEAHESTEKSYTNLLEFLGLERGRTGCPLIGLTATPYRGTSESETLRLVRRFSEQRLDQGVLGDEPYWALQERGVLAKVRHVELAGAVVDLSPSELEHVSRYRVLPPSVEGQLGKDISRTRLILESVLSLPRDWPVLLFATSVEHSQTMAALLSLNGVAAVSISGNTDPGARRHYIEQFRAGNLKVLTNYAVLTQGFDAPRVRAIVVARPTYSPNLYQQMIGRGLRGPQNQGTEECLIVNVRDNISQYGERLAFTQFEHLWSPTEARN
jgi:superfamily II DNA or RNA helicase